MWNYTYQGKQYQSFQNSKGNYFKASRIRSQRSNQKALHVKEFRNIYKKVSKRRSLFFASLTLKLLSDIINSPDLWKHKVFHCFPCNFWL